MLKKASSPPAHRRVELSLDQLQLPSLKVVYRVEPRGAKKPFSFRITFFLVFSFFFGFCFCSGCFLFFDLNIPFQLFHFLDLPRKYLWTPPRVDQVGRRQPRRYSLVSVVGRLSLRADLSWASLYQTARRYRR